MMLLIDIIQSSDFDELLELEFFINIRLQGFVLPVFVVRLFKVSNKFLIKKDKFILNISNCINFAY